MLTLKLFTILMDSELAAGEQLSSWVLRAPTLKDRVELGKIMAEELSHGWAVAQLIETDFPKKGEEIVAKISQRRMGNHHLYPFNQQFSCWEEIAIYTLLMDGSAEYIIGNFSKSSFKPLVRFLLKDEADHVNFGYQRIGLLYQVKPALVTRLLRKWWPLALGNFGRADSQYDQRKLEWGLVSRSNEENRQAFIKAMRSRFSKLGIPLPV